MPNMKVHELINALEELQEPDLEVDSEGCDCFGGVETVVIAEVETYKE